MNSQAFVASRLTTLCVAAVGVLLSACAETVATKSKPAPSRQHAAARAPDSPARRSAAAAPSAAKAPQPEAAIPPDVLFDSRRIEGAGTLLLDDIMALVGQAPRLRDEVQAALQEINQMPKDITCIGKRIDGRWKYLAGARVQPYVCKIGTRWLELSADLHISGTRGEPYSTVSDIAAQNAKTIKETNPRWTWTTVKPSSWFLE